MARVFAILLLVSAVWYAADYLGAGMGEEAPSAEQSHRETARGDPADSDRPEPVTTRVRNRVTEAVEEGARRHTGGR